MIDVAAAEQLLDFGKRIGAGQRAREQLEGAVAIRNTLERHRVAYLADEVGMGKTYVALGVVALFRHFDPSFRVLVIAPRENIQTKWMKELENFTHSNVRFADMRVKGLDGRPARALVKCENLAHLVRETALDPNRDFFARLSSFSLGLAENPESRRTLRDPLRRELPWLADEVFDLRSKMLFKDNFARAVCCALPVFDLVIVDEGHNMKHGFGPGVAARNRVLALSLGHPSEQKRSRLFPSYGPRARRVLFLSATPIEDSYRQLWNQLDVLGHGAVFEDLRRDVPDEVKKKVAASILIRRVTAIRVGGEEYTKNLYRREWRRGGVLKHDEPIRVEDDRQRLIVALVQKKVSELLGSERFGSSFQIGMLASFESFLETAQLKRSQEETGNFDDADQTEDVQEREGVDVHDLNRLASSYRRKFGAEMPHPKMDAVVQSLADAWRTGMKSLVFVRRIRSVTELKRKLDEIYDTWLIDELRHRLPKSQRPRLESAVKRYRQEKAEYLDRGGDVLAGESATAMVHSAFAEDRGGKDTFFAWFFRGEGPEGFVSGATIARRFITRTSAQAMFFEENYVADLLGCRPGDVRAELARALGLAEHELEVELRRRAKRFIGRALRLARADRFVAFQAAAVEMLKDHSGPLRDAARVVWHERFESSAKATHTETEPELGDALEWRTFWTELRQRPALRARLWPEPKGADPKDAFRERELRAQLLASAARLGHALIDLYVLATSRSDDAEQDLIRDYLELLERQMHEDPASRGWRAFDELEALASNFDLILDVNLAADRSKPLAECARLFGALLRQQQPIGGMFGQVNQTLVRQFRLPGYPLVLISTDLLQEGEDLHTFCSSIQHYGISWTPSSMEQRIGRIDRVQSQTDRRLSRLDRAMAGDDKLQVYYPYLADTVEVLQVQQVLRRMNDFLRLVHEGLIQSVPGAAAINVGQKLLAAEDWVAPIESKLRTAFPIARELLRGPRKKLAVEPASIDRLRARFEAIRELELPYVHVTWEELVSPGALYGTVKLVRRIQPILLVLQSFSGRPLVRCISPIGRVSPDEQSSQDRIAVVTRNKRIRLGAIVTSDERSYDLTVQEDVLLAGAEHDAARIGALIEQVAREADLLEQAHLPGQDEPLATFQGDLEKESARGE